MLLSSIDQGDGKRRDMAASRMIAGRAHSRNRHLTRDEAFLIAVNIAKLPSVPRQILKDIPRPPNSASRDD
jgi:hypothetical protein